ncbi:TetR/AcrR family transcriptional regulator [Flavobacterium sp. H122]|uniref:TetR/AcrR family transcriptional regulator n=1 Tax=Flavobacterium sp. H122 TaxID=2529860 RepID=UPI0010AB1E5C|nr:TetR family transcriptional regulator [Flavobacterium sp. H122]
MSQFNDKQIAILQVAEKLFAENGFDGTSIRDISKAAQINVAMVSYYFGSKERLLEDLIIYRSANLKLQMESISNQETDPLVKIEKLVELYLVLIHKNKCIYQIMNAESSNPKREIDTNLYNESKKNNFRMLNKIITEGQEKNIFKKNININLIPPTIIGTYLHFYNSKSFFKDLLGLTNDVQFDNYIHNELTQHIKQIIKSLIINENK